MREDKKIIFRAAIFILLDFLVVAAIRELADIYGEWLWFKSLHYAPVFWTMLLAKGLVGGGFGAAFVLMAGLNMYLARKAGPPKGPWELSYRTQEPEGVRVIRLKPSQVNILLVGVCLIFGLLMGLWPAFSQWDALLRFWHQKPFSLSDPIFHRDIGFFVFSYPVYLFLQRWLFCSLLIISLLVGYTYVKDKAMNLKPGQLSFSRRAKAHLSILNGFILALIAWDNRLKTFDLLYSNRGVVFGAGYTDIKAQLFAYWVLIAMAAVCALLFWFNTSAEGWRWPLIGLTALMALSILGNSLYPWLFQKFVVLPNELSREEPFIRHNIYYTRLGYHLDQVEEKEFRVSAELRSENIGANFLTLKKIKLWDKSPLKQTYRQLQEIRLYYSFTNVDEDRYLLHGQKTQIMLSIRELDQDNLPTQAKTFENRYFKYTHGYGLCMSPVDTITEKGLPKLLIKDIPPISQSGLFDISRPEIYYGEKTTDFVIVNTMSPEFDYPKGDINVYTHYQEKAGVPIGSFFNRLVFSIKYLEPKILFTSYLRPQSRILFHRQIKDRVKTLAPFLTYDRDPYAVVSDEGRIFWILDAYTTTDKYPYSEQIFLFSNSDQTLPVALPLSEGQMVDSKKINYIRNSVKITIDAYSGATAFYIADEEDPIIQTYCKIFPQLFKPLAKMPQDLRAHIRYPRDLFEIQANMYRRYHMGDAQVFYNQEDLWDLPLQRGSGQSGSQMKGYYLTVRLAGCAEEEFLLMVPFTPHNKSNMIAWMCARCDGANYGKLLVYKLPKKTLIYGPRQIEARIDQQTEISSRLTLWSQQGSDVFRGDLLVIPIEESILYVEPIYLLANDQSNVPELKQVIVACGEKIEMRQTLNEALQGIFGAQEISLVSQQGPTYDAPYQPAGADLHEQPAEAVDWRGLKPLTKESIATADQSIIDLAKSVSRYFQAATDSFRRKDWAEYGRCQAKMHQAIQDLSAALDKSEKMKQQISDHNHQNHQPKNHYSGKDLSNKLAHRQ